ncbi:hypothetical protein D3C80_1273020 [compost metagenome]
MIGNAISNRSTQSDRDYDRQRQQDLQRQQDYQRQQQYQQQQAQYRQQQYQQQQSRQFSQPTQQAYQAPKQTTTAPVAGAFSRNKPAAVQQTSYNRPAQNTYKPATVSRPAKSPMSKSTSRR